MGEVEGIWPGGSPGAHMGGSAPGGVCTQGVPAPVGSAPRGVETPPPVMATAADGTQPTGMHSCLGLRVHSRLRFIRYDLLRHIFSPCNDEKRAHNPLLNFSVHS